MIIKTLRLVIYLLAACTPAVDAQPVAGTFTNPLVRSRDAADPWLVYHEGYYYFTATLDADGGIWVWKSRTLAGLDAGTKVKVHTPETKERGRQLWAPELHFINRRWYLYYTASDGVDENHRLYVLESRGLDPLGPYAFKARLYDLAHDGWAIDPTVFRAPDGRLYLLWVAHVPGNGNGIRMAPMSNPWTVAGRSALITQAGYGWERVRYPINEGPVVLQRAGRIFLIYSASDTGTPDYALGMLTHTGGDDVMNSEAWKKSPLPVFKRHSGADGDVYGPGHNGFFKSPDGTEDWIVYHGKETSEYTYAGRTTRAQKFRWRSDGTPDFGRPIPGGIPLQLPSGDEGATRLQKWDFKIRSSAGFRWVHSRMLIHTTDYQPNSAFAPQLFISFYLSTHPIKAAGHRQQSSCDLGCRSASSAPYLCLYD